MINKIYNEDCLLTLERMENKTIDAVITDAPYGISKEIRITRNKNGMKFKGKDINYNFGEWDNIDDIMLFTKNWLLSVDRILKDDCSLIVFFDRDKINYIADYMKELGYKRRNYIYFVKKNPVPQARKINWQSSVEQGVILTKGKHHYNWEEGQRPEHWVIPICGGNERTAHPTQKPLIIFKDLIRWWTFKNDLIYDPFMGVATTAIAALKLNRNYIGSEISKEYCEIAEKRIKEVTDQYNLDL